MKVTTKKSVLDQYDEDFKHDEIVAQLATRNGAHPADIFALETRTANRFAWVWLLACETLGLGGMATGADIGASLVFAGLGLLAIPFMIGRKKRIQILRAQPQATQQVKHKTPEEERAELKEEIRREMLKEELRKEIEAENKK